ncbi:MAG: PfkB family carbohydrate kinase [Endomicrobiaceae bacterium]|jgi:sugar/nucleoside kinase (ribokinase family)|nr:PfkB family carbohydrate kinase [Endomicrobiaceae bacterium]
MSLLIVGSVALDTVEANKRKIKDALGGSAMYSSMSASYFADTAVVAVVGADFPYEYIRLLNRHKIDTSGLAVSSGKTFRWCGKYSCDLNQAKTINTQLNVFSDFTPVLSKEHKSSKYLFLANVDPDIQEKVLDSVKNPKFVALDTMNLWISKKIQKLKSVFKRIDLLLINEDEAKQLSKKNNIIQSAKKIMSMGPEILVIKRGEFGAMLFYKNNLFSIPSFPLEKVEDTTGAGDTFAGGFIGYLASCPKITFQELKKAMVYGSVMASFNVESFSLGKLSSLTLNDISKRFTAFKKITEF